MLADFDVFRNPPRLVVASYDPDAPETPEPAYYDASDPIRVTTITLDLFGPSSDDFNRATVRNAAELSKREGIEFRDKDVSEIIHAMLQEQMEHLASINPEAFCKAVYASPAAQSEIYLLAQRATRRTA
jgi:hypothetical protein